MASGFEMNINEDVQSLLPSCRVKMSLFLLSLHGYDVKMSNFPFYEVHYNKFFCLFLNLDIGS